MRCIQSILRYIFSGKCLKMYFKFIKKGDRFLRTGTFSLQCLQIRKLWFVIIFFVRDFDRVIISWNNGKPIIHEKWHKRTVSSYVEMMWLYWSCFWVFWDISGHLLTNPYLHYLGMLSLSLRSIICWGKLLEEDEHFCVSSLTVL